MLTNDHCVYIAVLEREFDMCPGMNWGDASPPSFFQFLQDFCPIRSKNMETLKKKLEKLENRLKIGKKPTNNFAQPSAA